MTERAAFFTFSLFLALVTGAMIGSSAIEEMRRLEMKRMNAIEAVQAAPKDAKIVPLIVSPAPPVIIYSPPPGWLTETKPEGKTNGNPK